MRIIEAIRTRRLLELLLLAAVALFLFACRSAPTPVSVMRTPIRGKPPVEVEAPTAEERASENATETATSTVVETGAAPVPEIPEEAPLLVRSQPTSYHVRMSAVATHAGNNLTGLCVILPCPQSNEYQEIANLVASGGELLPIPGSDDVYARFLLSSGLPANGTSVEFAIEFDATIYRLAIDFPPAESLNPYDTAAAPYLEETGPIGAWVVPDAEGIRAAADAIAARTQDVVSYARECYVWASSHFAYLAAGTNLHPMAQILSEGGGDCANLASVYVALMRARDIPARHVVTIRPQVIPHVWAEFYLEGYGWVPVDVNVGVNEYRRTGGASTGNGFGLIGLEWNGVVFNRTIDAALDTGLMGTVNIPLLITYAYWFRSSGGAGYPTIRWTFAATPVQ